MRVTEIRTGNPLGALNSFCILPSLFWSSKFFGYEERFANKKEVEFFYIGLLFLFWGVEIWIERDRKETNDNASA